MLSDPAIDVERVISLKSLRCFDRGGFELPIGFDSEVERLGLEVLAPAVEVHLPRLDVGPLVAFAEPVARLGEGELREIGFSIAVGGPTVVDDL